MNVRLADPTRDADAVAAIYRPTVDDSIASFEEIAPDGVEMAQRMRTTLERTPWLVAEDDGRVVVYAYAGRYHERPGYRWSVGIFDRDTPRGVERRARLDRIRGPGQRLLAVGALV